MPSINPIDYKPVQKQGKYENIDVLISKRYSPAPIDPNSFTSRDISFQKNESTESPCAKVCRLGHCPCGGRLIT